MSSKIVPISVVDHSPLLSSRITERQSDCITTRSSPSVNANRGPRRIATAYTRGGEKSRFLTASQMRWQSIYDREEHTLCQAVPFSSIAASTHTEITPSSGGDHPGVSMRLLSKADTIIAFIYSSRKPPVHSSSFPRDHLSFSTIILFLDSIFLTPR